MDDWIIILLRSSSHPMHLNLFQSNPMAWDPALTVMKARNLVCQISRPHYHQFLVTATYKEGYACDWTGVSCIPPTLTDAGEGEDAPVRVLSK